MDESKCASCSENNPIKGSYFQRFGICLIAGKKIYNIKTGMAHCTACDNILLTPDIYHNKLFSMVLLLICSIVGFSGILIMDSSLRISSLYQLIVPLVLILIYPSVCERFLTAIVFTVFPWKRVGICSQNKLKLQFQREQECSIYNHHRNRAKITANALITLFLLDCNVVYVCIFSVIAGTIVSICTRKINTLQIGIGLTALVYSVITIASGWAELNQITTVLNICITVIIMATVNYVFE